MSLNLAFFGLQQKPFNPTPDPRFLYPSPGHREALAQLLYGVQEHKGFILLTGEIGTGKTTLLRTLLEPPGRQLPPLPSSSTRRCLSKEFSSTCSRTSAWPRPASPTSSG